MNESSLERNIQKFVGQCQNEMASVEKRLSNFILELSVQIANLRIKLNHAEISGTNQNDDSSLSLSEAIFFITDKEQNEADWTANASEHITAKGSFLSAFWANSNLRISMILDRKPVCQTFLILHLLLLAVIGLAVIGLD